MNINTAIARAAEAVRQEIARGNPDVLRAAGQRVEWKYNPSRFYLPTPLPSERQVAAPVDEADDWDPLLMPPADLRRHQYRPGSGGPSRS